MTEFEPDLIVLDLLMTGMDGFEACKRIKENPSTFHIRVLAVSGYGTDENRERILEAGANGFMAKPVDNAAFLKEIKRLCQASELSPEENSVFG